MTEDNKVIVGLDAMGGDLAPAETVNAAIWAVHDDEDVIVKLYGDEARVNAELKKYKYDTDRIEVIHCASVIENCDQPTRAIRSKRDSSMVMGLYGVKHGEADAFVSCGNTGALLVGGQLIVGRLPGIERPALAFIVPSAKGPVMIIDCGANVDTKPKVLVQFAQMATVYMQTIVGIENPRVGIVNIGEEEEKGNALVQETIPLLKSCEGINYAGSIESRGITEGVVDIVVCDAFVGNVILKMYEGVAKMLLKEIKGVLMTNMKTKIGAALIKSDLKKTLKTFSIEEYGGAPMLGLKSLVAKTHGNSKAVEIRNTILQCKTFVQNDVTGRIADKISGMTIDQAEKTEE